VIFKDRRDAGEQLSRLLTKYKGQETVIFAIPRGGIVVAEPIAASLSAPIDLLLAHKIGHPGFPEYAVAAVSESGHVIGNEREIASLGTKWLEAEKIRQIAEIKRKRDYYLKGQSTPSLKDKVAIIVDDGIATGLTVQAGVLEIKDRKPKKIVVAVPVAPQSTADKIGAMVDDFVGVEIPEDYRFLGAVGAYYQEFYQTEDDEVKEILERFQKKR
jgi:predicted phosphoribosyltransferase